MKPASVLRFIKPRNTKENRLKTARSETKCCQRHTSSRGALFALLSPESQQRLSLLAVPVTVEAFPKCGFSTNFELYLDNFRAELMSTNYVFTTNP